MPTTLKKKMSQSLTKQSTEESLPQKAIDDLWFEDPSLIRRFLDQRSSYEQLCIEVAYILKKKLTASRIEVASIPWRAKALNSFIEKVQRKQYSEPFSEMTDFAGVRVVCLYFTDIVNIEKLIRVEFDVVEKIDKLSELSVDQFGYGAVHFIVRLGKKSFGARYDDLKNLFCEIQVRTVVQDAWSIIEHHLIYKKRSEIPKSLLRKLSGLAAILENADEQFELVRQERNKYLERVRKQKERPKQFLENELNFDTFNEYLSWRFRDIPIESGQGRPVALFEILDKSQYKKLADLDRIVNQTESLRSKIRDQLVNEGRLVPSAANEMAISLAIIDSSFRRYAEVPQEWRQLIEASST